VISGDNSVAMIREIVCYSRFGLLADSGSIFLRFFWSLEIRKGFARFKRFTMLGCEAILIDGGDMGFGAVADVLVKTIVGIFGSEVFHILVTGDFGDDGSGGNLADESVGFDAGSDVRCERSVLEKIGFAIDNNLGKRCVKRLN